MKFILFILLGLLVLILADPLPSGGGFCQRDIDCGGVDGGICDCPFSSSCNGTCVCSDDRGDPDCSYRRVSRQFAFSIQWLWLVGIGGGGRFVLGLTGTGVVQLLLGLVGCWGICIIGCIAVCTGAAISQKLGAGVAGLGGCLLCLAILSWFVWVIVDLVMIGQGNLSDSDGYSTTPNL